MISADEPVSRPHLRGPWPPHRRTAG